MKLFTMNNNSIMLDFMSNKHVGDQVTVRDLTQQGERHEKSASNTRVKELSDVTLTDHKRFGNRQPNSELRLKT